MWRPRHEDVWDLFELSNLKMTPHPQRATAKAGFPRGCRLGSRVDPHTTLYTLYIDSDTACRPRGRCKMGTEVAPALSTGMKSAGNTSGAGEPPQPRLEFTLPIRYNPIFGFYLCSQCSTSLWNVREHFSCAGPHGNQYAAALPNFEFVLGRYPERNPYASLPNWISPRRPLPLHIDGIPAVSHGHSCNLCPFVHPRRQAVLDHIRAQHPLLLDQQAGEPIANLQRFFDREDAPWFPSSAPITAPSVSQPTLLPGVNGVIPVPPQSGGPSCGAQRIRPGQADKPSRPQADIQSDSTSSGTGGPLSASSAIAQTRGRPCTPPPLGTKPPPSHPSIPPPRKFIPYVPREAAQPPSQLTTVRAAPSLDLPAMSLRLAILETQSSGMSALIQQQAAAIQGLEQRLEHSDTFARLAAETICRQAKSIEALEGRVQTMTDIIKEACERAAQHTAQAGKAELGENLKRGSEGPGAVDETGKMCRKETEEAELPQLEETNEAERAEMGTEGHGDTGSAELAGKTSTTNSETSPPSTLMADSGYIVNDSIFGELPIAYHRQYHFYRCTECGHSLRNLRDHFRTADFHKESFESTRHLLPFILSGYPEADPYSLLPPSVYTSTPSSYIPGIPLSDGYGCNLCPYYAIHKSAMLTHVYGLHPRAETKVKASLAYRPVANLQNFFAGTKRPISWFPSSAPGMVGLGSAACSPSSPDGPALASAAGAVDSEPVTGKGEDGRGERSGSVGVGVVEQERPRPTKKRKFDIEDDEVEVKLEPDLAFGEGEALGKGGGGVIVFTNEGEESDYEVEEEIEWPE